MCALCWQTEGGLARQVVALAGETPARLLRTGGAGSVVMTAKCVSGILLEQEIGKGVLDLCYIDPLATSDWDPASTPGAAFNSKV